MAFDNVRIESIKSVAGINGLKSCIKLLDEIEKCSMYASDRVTRDMENKIIDTLINILRCEHGSGSGLPHFSLFKRLTKDTESKFIELVVLWNQLISDEYVNKTSTIINKIDDIACKVNEKVEAQNSRACNYVDVITNQIDIFINGIDKMVANEYIDVNDGNKFKINFSKVKNTMNNISDVYSEKAFEKCKLLADQILDVLDVVCKKINNPEYAKIINTVKSWCELKVSNNNKAGIKFDFKEKEESLYRREIVIATRQPIAEKTFERAKLKKEEITQKIDEIKRDLPPEVNLDARIEAIKKRFRNGEIGKNEAIELRKNAESDVKIYKSRMKSFGKQQQLIDAYQNGVILQIEKILGTYKCFSLGRELLAQFLSVAPLEELLRYLEGAKTNTASFVHIVDNFMEVYARAISEDIVDSEECENRDNEKESQKDDNENFDWLFDNSNDNNNTNDERFNDNQQNHEQNEELF